MRKPMLLQLAEHVGCTFSGRVTKEAIVNALDRHYNPVNPIDLGEVEIAIPDPIPESQDSREGSEAGSCPTGSGDNGGLPTPTQTSSPHQHLVDKVLDVLAGTGVDPAKWNFMLGEMTFKTVELEALKAGQIGEELLERLLEVIPEKLHDFKEALEFAKSRGFKVPF